MRRTRGRLCGRVSLWLMTAAACGLTGAVVAAQSQTAPTSQKVSVKPGINDAYRDAKVEEWTERFETESREVFRERARIVADVDLNPGAVVADVGAGTGLFTELFASAVGPGGVVYAVDITPEFVRHIEQRMKTAGHANVRPVLCAADSTNLPTASIDVAFICDTYHHFEYPAETLRSLHAALRPGGVLVVVDFERIEGVSSDWVLDHVRAGRDTFVSEIARAGFELVEKQPRSAQLFENYMLRFRKKP